MKIIKTLALIVVAVLLSACDRAPANVKVLFTKDCGSTWSIVKSGDRIPNSVTACEYKTVLPDFPMQGDLEFKAPFAGGVVVTMKINYDYTIEDPILYIGEAKFLGKASGSAQNAADGTNMAAIEMAENSVIDRRVREVATTITEKANIVQVNQSEMESSIEKSLMADLKKRGIAVGSISMVMVPEDQTRLAIDTATAMRVYQSNGMLDFGMKMAIAKAGASTVVVNDRTQSAK